MLRTRPATIDDAERIADLAAQLASHQGDECRLDAEAVRRDGFGADRAFYCIVAEMNDNVVGYAILTPWYEPAAAARGLYIADLFVSPDARGHGLGFALIRAAVAEAVRQKMTFVGWLSKAWNKSAHAFYSRIGAIHEPAVGHALFGEAFDRLAQDAYQSVTP